MNKKAKRSFAVSLAVTLSVVLIAAVAFPLGSVRAETDPLDNIGAGSSSSAVSDNSSSSKASSVKPKPSTPQPEVTLNFNGGTGGGATLYVPSGTKVGDLETPVRKGYKFVGWASGGNDIMSNYKISDNISLTAQWEKEKSESNKSSKTKSSSQSPSTSYKPVDTHQSQVNEAASNAEAAVSDPDTLSSQDWSDIFSSGESQSSAAGAAGLLSSENGSNSGGGSSWLFIAGIVLIILAACGIGLFIYLQFFHTPRSGGRRNKGMSYDNDDTEEIDSFTDISSDSSGTQQRNDVNGNENTKPIIMSDSAVKSEIIRNSKSQGSTRGVSHQAPPSHAAPKARAVPPSHAAPKAHAVPPSHAAPKAQAKPVDGSKSDFDWDKFFNDDNI